MKVRTKHLVSYLCYYSGRTGPNLYCFLYCDRLRFFQTLIYLSFSTIKRGLSVSRCHENNKKLSNKAIKTRKNSFFKFLWFNRPPNYLFSDSLLFFRFFETTLDPWCLPKICIKYRKHWKKLCGFLTVWADRAYLGSSKTAKQKPKYATF